MHLEEDCDDDQQNMSYAKGALTVLEYEYCESSTGIPQHLSERGGV